MKRGLLPKHSALSESALDDSLPERITSWGGHYRFIAGLDQGIRPWYTS